MQIAAVHKSVCGPNRTCRPGIALLEVCRDELRHFEHRDLVFVEVLTATCVLLGLGAVFVCFKLLIVHPVPATVRHSA